MFAENCPATLYPRAVIGGNQQAQAVLPDAVCKGRMFFVMFVMHLVTAELFGADLWTKRRINLGVFDFLF